MRWAVIFTGFGQFVVCLENKDAFGGGDIKLLAALGAWLGFEKLLYVIVVSAVLFILYAAIKRQRSGAYGPAIAIAGIIVAFYFFKLK